MDQLPIFQDDEPVFRRFLPIVQKVSHESIETNIWDIPYTIPELSYLTHGHFRYYGKFPPAIAGLLIEKYPPSGPEDYIFDNFCGSGTTLVEAAIRGYSALGVDANWLAVLASNVKVTHISRRNIRSSLAHVLKIFSDLERPNVDHLTAEKWFSPIAAHDLGALASAIRTLEPSAETNFLVLALLAIIRRVSLAFDAEVRPHVNKNKKPREVLPAFSKKVRDMIVGHESYMAYASPSNEARCILADNRDLRDVPSRNIHLAISHPPYLNSFNYRPVFSLERRFAEGFAPPFAESLFKESELVAHPANATVTKSYFEHLKACYEALSERQSRGSILAVVIGDCTVKHELVPVVDMTADLLGPIGYDLIEINYRTTHYGLGKYAYSHRADYHGDATKKDGILVFRRR